MRIVPDAEPSEFACDRIGPPIKNQRFDNFQQWVNKASSWLTQHPEYNNTEHGETKGWRGHHFTAMCFDSVGRRCLSGADFRRAEKDGAFPIWWIWPDQIPFLVGFAAAPETTASTGSAT
jgi:hypothetical protein